MFAQQLIRIEALRIVQLWRNVELFQIEDRQHVVQDLVIVRDRFRLVLRLSLLTCLHSLKEFIRVDTGLFILLGQRCQSLQSDERGLDSVPIHLIRLLSVVDRVLTLLHGQFD